MSEENNFLGEGFDFIEEATPFSAEPLEFQDIEKLDISESESTKSPWKLIGKVKGCMAPIGAYSRNHRIYENSHWIKVLQNPMLQERLANRRMFGMPSHMQKKIDDEDFREGRISHIVSVLEVREDNNGKPFLYGEFDILDTPAGRILKAMYEGGAGIYVSTRAAGKLEPIVGDPINKRVCSDSYYLNSIDCVLEPGFLQAKPAFEAISLETPAPAIHESKQETTNLTESVVQSTNESQELQALQSQLNKLTKIIEKVVDDVYEVEEASQEQSANESDDDYEWSVVRKNALANPNLYGGRYTDKDAKKAKQQYLEDKRNKQEQSKKALAEAVDVLLASKIKKSTLKGILEELVKAKKQIQQ